jgi:hypothetical protein
LENVFLENVFQNIIEKPNFVKRFDGERTHHIFFAGHEEWNERATTRVRPLDLDTV